MLRLASGLAIIGVLGWGVVNCSGSTAPKRDGFDDTSTTSTGSGATGTGSPGSGGTNIFNPAGGSGGGSADSGRMTIVDEAGNATCINLASVGKPAAYGALDASGGAPDGTKSFEDWLNSKSSARATFLTTHQPITADLLMNYDVIIIQALMDDVKVAGSEWTFTQDEVDALTKWVNDGGGLITLQGYSADPNEVNPVNQLLQFTGISYNKDDVFTCPSGTCPTAYCTGSSFPMTGWVSTDPIGANITAEPAFHGRTINPGDGIVVASAGSSTVYAVRKEVGMGKVFVFSDEWVTYSSQWGAPLPQNLNPNDMCYMKGADKVFQVPQFWYNAIKWVSPKPACFTINDPGIVN